jgi:hypothetical protein
MAYWILNQANNLEVAKKPVLYKSEIDEISILQLSNEIKSLNKNLNTCLEFDVAAYGYCQTVTDLNSRLDVSFLKKSAELTFGQTSLQGVINRSGNDIFGNPYLVSPGKNGVHVSPKTFAKLVYFIQQQPI